MLKKLENKVNNYIINNIKKKLQLLSKVQNIKKYAKLKDLLKIIHTINNEYFKVSFCQYFYILLVFIYLKNKSIKICKKNLSY